MTAFTVESVRHRALGPLVRLRVGEAPALAVQGGRSPEHTIFMSPIASDGDFTATVEGDGLAVGDGEQHRLSWPEVERLAGLLAGA
jgi:hypothetical protein